MTSHEFLYHVYTKQAKVIKKSVFYKNICDITLRIGAYSNFGLGDVCVVRLRKAKPIIVATADNKDELFTLTPDNVKHLESIRKNILSL